MAQAYPHIVYGVRTTKPIPTSGYPDEQELAEQLGLPEGVVIQPPDIEQGWEWNDIHPVIYIKASECHAYTHEEFNGSVEAVAIAQDWDSRLLEAVKAVGLDVEMPPRWYAFVQKI